MARNAIQFQKGLSEPAFLEEYGTEPQCLAALEALRWPDGFVCPMYGHAKEHRLHSRPRLHECAACHHQASVTAGTILHRTKLPLTQGFRAMYHLTQSKNGVSARELSRRLGVQYNTAWKLKHKLMQVMKERDSRIRLTERVEIDDAYLGGERAKVPGKAGRGAPGKTPFVAAVETEHDGTKPKRIVLQVVDGFTSAEIADFARRKLAPSAEVVSDGLSCFPFVTEAGCSHSVRVSCGARRESVEAPTFKWVNTTLGNIKSALTGTYRHLSGKHAPRYLAEFQYRYNRRVDQAAMLPRLAYVSLRTPPMPYALLKLPESNA